jgi:23S rRNA (cytidine2498-2'-O)-methyltransferase
VKALAFFHEAAERLAMRELAARAAGLRPGDPIAPGARIVEWDGSFDELHRILSDDPPVFVRDIQPIEEGVLPRERLRRYAYTICRSELKLLEAVGLFGIPTPRGGLAVDLGAAPGGWSYILASRGMRVIAVDPGDLRPLAAGHPNVEHVRTTAGQFLKTAGRGSAALLVNDMKMEPGRSCDVTLDYAPILEPGGWAVMTLKLPSNAASSWPGIIGRSRDALKQSYAVMGIRQLRANRSEATCVMARLG